jgi:hypothetical protein
LPSSFWFCISYRSAAGLASRPSRSVAGGRPLHAILLAALARDLPLQPGQPALHLGDPRRDVGDRGEQLVERAFLRLVAVTQRLELVGDRDRVVDRAPSGLDVPDVADDVGVGLAALGRLCSSTSIVRMPATSKGFSR